MTIKVTVSGKTYYGACDPLATGVPKESGWPEPTRVLRGKGRQFVYEMDTEMAEGMLDHLETLAYIFTADGYRDNEESYREGKAVQRDADKLRAQLAAAVSA